MAKANGSPAGYHLRRAAALLLSLLFLLSCAGCGKKEDTPEKSVTGGGPGEVISTDTPFQINATERYNLVLVLDTSGTMNRSDPDSKAMDAACMFLDSLFIAGQEGENRQGVPNTTIGVVAYNDKADVVHYISEIVSEDGVSMLKQKIYSLVCKPDAGDDGLGDAIYSAAEMLNRVNPPAQVQMGEAPPPGASQKNMIVLFTDGYDGVLPGGSSASAVTNPNQMPGPGMPNPNLLPSFGSPVQERLTSGLDLAVRSMSEIFVVGLDTDRLSSQWKQFRNIANYTQQMMPGPPPGDMPAEADQAGGMPFGPGMMTTPAQGGQADMPGMQPGMPGMPGMQPGMPGMGMPGMGMPGMPPPGMGPGPMPEIMAGNSGIFTRDSDDTQFVMDPSRGVNYYRAFSIVQVQYFYVQLLASIMQGSGAISRTAVQPSEWSQYTVPVSAAGNSALLFFLLSESPVTGMRLVDPDNEEINLFKLDDQGWNADKTVRLQWWKGYTTLSVMDPKQGDWVFMARDKEARNPFQAQYILVGGVLLDLKVFQSSDQQNLSEAYVVLQATYRGEPVGEEFYAGAECTCEVFQMPPPPPMMQNGQVSMQRGPQGAAGGAQGVATQEAPMQGPPPMGMMESQTVTLSYNEAYQALAGTFTVQQPGDYQIRASVKSSEVPYSMEKSVSLMPGTPQTIVFSGKNAKKTLKPELIGWENLSTTVESWTVQPENLLNISLNSDGSLALQAQQSGTGTLSVIVYSSSGGDAGQQMQRWNLSYPIQVGS